MRKKEMEERIRELSQEIHDLKEHFTTQNGKVEPLYHWRKPLTDKIKQSCYKHGITPEKYQTYLPIHEISYKDLIDKLIKALGLEIIYKDSVPGGLELEKK